MRVRTVSENAKHANDARNKKLSPKRRKEIAVNAANARWLKHKKKAPVGVSPARR
jgi:flagellar basal body rod protein FlgC